MRKDKHPDMARHFHQLKELLPDLYKPSQEERLVLLLRKALGALEATYLQSPEGFPESRAVVYSSIVDELNSFGLDYHPNDNLYAHGKARLVLPGKLPMKRVESKQSPSQNRQEVG